MGSAVSLMTSDSCLAGCLVILCCDLQLSYRPLLREPATRNPQKRGLRGLISSDRRDDHRTACGQRYSTSRRLDMTAEHRVLVLHSGCEGALSDSIFECPTSRSSLRRLITSASHTFILSDYDRMLKCYTQTASRLLSRAYNFLNEKEPMSRLKPFGSLSCVLSTCHASKIPGDTCSADWLVQSSLQIRGFAI